jgi:integrase
MEWEDKRAMLINMVAMTTGLRRGEILALKVENIGEKYLTIENSFSEIDGLKSTKTDEERIVPIIPAIRDAMLDLAKTNTRNNGYIFSSDRKDRPYNSATPTSELKKMLFRLRAGENPSPEQEKEVREYWKKRNVDFHSWRHFYASRMTDKIAARKVMLATGHKTEAVFKAYSDHALESDLLDVAVVTGEVFGGLLPDTSIA